MIDALALQSARSSIRTAWRLPEDEIVDLVFLASVLCNFDPERTLPIWLVVVGSPSSAKTEITSLIRNWRYTHPLPAKISGGYFFSSRTRKESVLPEIEAKGARILYIDDLAGVVSMDIEGAGHLYSQLIGIHDGHVIHRTGFSPDEMLYGPKEPKDRLGFIGSATERFYGFQERWFQFGSRFMVYYLPDVREGWDDYSHLTRISEIADPVGKRRHAEAAVQSFLDHALEQLPQDLPRVAIDREDVNRLSAAVTFVQRVLGAGRSNDPGVRLHRRVVHMVRMFAFMQSRTHVDPVDVDNGMRVILSQLPAHEHKIIKFALLNIGQPWDFSSLLDFAGGSRKIYAGPLETLADVRVLVRAGERGNKGYRFDLHDKARKLVNVFDPDKRIFPR